MVGVSDLNPFKNFNIGLGTVGNILLLFAIAVVIMGLIVLAVWLWIDKKRYRHIIPLYRRVGNRTLKVGVFKAKDFAIGKAGDKLWFVKGIRKFIPPATLQTGPNEYSHFEREDGEWINIDLPDINEGMRKLKVKFVHQDMRSNRLATDRLLEQRLMKKGFWDKYGDLIMHIIFYMIITISLVVIFWQWSGIVDKTAQLIDKINALLETKGGQNSGIVPALTLLFWKLRR